MSWIRSTTELVHASDADPQFYLDCETCGAPLVLKFNGGELDAVDCPCGERRYSLEIGSVHLVTSRYAR